MNHRSRPIAFAMSALVMGGAALSACSSSPTLAASANTTAAGAASRQAGGTTFTTATASAVTTIQLVSTPYGRALGSEDGRVLYAWDQEADGTIACRDAACLEKWPPLLASSVDVADGLDASSFTVIDRPDGTKQVALHGRPLYNMNIDAPGEANCQGSDGWWILHPDGSKNTATTPAL